MAFSPDGHRLVTRSPHEISVFRVRDGVKLNSFRMEHGGPRSEVTFASDGRRLVADVPEGVRIWSLDGKESRLLRHEKGWPPFALSGNGTHLATLDDKTIRVWDIAAGSELARTTLPLEPYGHTSMEQFAFAGKRDDLIVSSGDRLVRVLWRTEDLIQEGCRRLLHNLSEEERSQFQAELNVGGACATSVNAKSSPHVRTPAIP